MNNVTGKRWLLLLVLLAVTLVLVWKAPKSGQEAQLVSASRDITESAKELRQSQLVSEEIVLRQRQIAIEKIDLFDVPTTKLPVSELPKPIKTELINPITIPFRYIGMLEEKQQTTLFLMGGRTLYLVKEGDTVKEHFQLKSIDMANKQLIWLYLPLNEIHEMSIEK
jgi:hypothetical protein